MQLWACSIPRETGGGPARARGRARRPCHYANRRRKVPSVPAPGCGGLGARYRRVPAACFDAGPTRELARRIRAWRRWCGSCCPDFFQRGRCGAQAGVCRPPVRERRRPATLHHARCVAPWSASTAFRDSHTHAPSPRDTGWRPLARRPPRVPADCCPARGGRGSLHLLVRAPSMQRRSPQPSPHFANPGRRRAGPGVQMGPRLSPLLPPRLPRAALAPQGPRPRAYSHCHRGATTWARGDTLARAHRPLHPSVSSETFAASWGWAAPQLSQPRWTGPTSASRCALPPSHWPRSEALWP